MENTTLKEIMSSFIQSIDIMNFLLKNHHRRVAVTAYHIGLSCNLPEERLKQLVLAASLHDIGALSIIERNQLIQMDIQDPHPHAIFGAAMLSTFRYFNDISKIIRYHHVYWNNGISTSKSDDILFESYILHLADRIEILIDHEIGLLDQIDVVRDQIINLKGSVFHPEVVKAFIKISNVDQFWLDIDNLPMNDLLDKVFLEEDPIPLTLDLLEDFTYTISRIVDFRSAFTATHSYGVGMIAFEIGKLYGMDIEKCRMLRVAGYLHDIGKIAIPTEILDKNIKLNQSEYNLMKSHPYYTNLILKNIKGLENISDWASMHHEKHDGSGYPFHITEAMMSIEMEIIAYADVFTALTEERPYRKGKDNEFVLQTIRDNFVPQLGETIYHIIELHIDELNEVRYLARTKALKEYQHATFEVKVGLK